MQQVPLNGSAFCCLLTGACNCCFLKLSVEKLPGLTLGGSVNSASEVLKTVNPVPIAAYGRIALVSFAPRVDQALNPHFVPQKNIRI